MILPVIETPPKHWIALSEDTFKFNLTLKVGSWVPVAKDNRISMAFKFASVRTVNIKNIQCRITKGQKIINDNEHYCTRNSQKGLRLIWVSNIIINL